jgi:hypothetical protein
LGPPVGGKFFKIWFKIKQRFISIRLVLGEKEIKMKNFVFNFEKFPCEAGHTSHAYFHEWGRPLA